MIENSTEQENFREIAAHPMDAEHEIGDLANGEEEELDGNPHHCGQAPLEASLVR